MHGPDCVEAHRMATWIALLRGIGGNVRPLPMKALVEKLERIGLSRVRTYVQSGNVVFEAPKQSASTLSRRIRSCIVEHFGFETDVLVLSVPELQRAADGNPFPEANDDPKSVHVFFLAEQPSAPNLAGMEKLRAPDERFELGDRAFYLHTPSGFAVSKLGPRVERLLGVTATARNWRTVTNVLALAKQPAPEQPSVGKGRPKKKKASNGRHKRGELR